jgi:hypothetical protein
VLWGRDLDGLPGVGCSGIIVEISVENPAPARGIMRDPESELKGGSTPSVKDSRIPGVPDTKYKLPELWHMARPFRTGALFAESKSNIDAIHKRANRSARHGFNDAPGIFTGRAGWFL